MISTRSSKDLRLPLSFINQFPISAKYIKRSYSLLPINPSTFTACQPSLRRPRSESHFNIQRRIPTIIYRNSSKKYLQTASIQTYDTETDESQTLEEDSDVDVFQVTSNEAEMRLDKLLASRFDARSRTYHQTLLTSGCVEVNGKLTKQKSRRMATGEHVAVRFLPLERELPIEAEAIPLSILYEDEHIAIIDKAAGMVVHPAPGHWSGTLVHALFYRYPQLAIDGDNRSGIIHRLDKNTSGVIITGKTGAAVAAMSELFAKRAIRKEYITVTVGNPAGEGCQGRVIDAGIGRSRTDRLRMSIIPEEAGGRRALSTVEVVASDSRRLLHACRVRIESGRTHQIRVHMRHVRAPVLGDDLYGAMDVNKKFENIAPRVMLHAHRLSFEHPFTGKMIDIKARLPEDFNRLMSRVVYPNYKQEQTEW